MKVEETTTRDMVADDGRLGRLLAAGVVVVIFAATVGVLLLHRSVTADLLSTRGDIGRFRGEEVQEAFHDRHEVIVNYEHNARYTFAFTLRNESRWAARVVDFPVAESDAMLQPMAFSVDTNPFGSPTPTFTPFQPFTVGPGDSVLVQVEAHFTNCDHYGRKSSETLLSLPVRYRVLWATRTHSVDLPTAVRVPAPETCPLP